MLNINYYDENSELSCKIPGNISLQKTQIATNLIVIVHFEDASTENTNSLTADWLLMMVSFQIESLLNE